MYCFAPCSVQDADAGSKKSKGGKRKDVNEGNFGLPSQRYVF